MDIQVNRTLYMSCQAAPGCKNKYNPEGPFVLYPLCILPLMRPFECFIRSTKR